MRRKSPRHPGLGELLLMPSGALTVLEMRRELLNRKGRKSRTYCLDPDSQERRRKKVYLAPAGDSCQPVCTNNTLEYCFEVLRN